MHLFLLLLRQEIMRHHREKLQKQDLFFVLSQLIWECKENDILLYDSFL